MDSDFEVSRAPTKQLLRDMRGAEAVLPAGVTHYHGQQGEDVRALAAALEKNSTVTSLDLVLNSIKDEGAERLAAALEKNSTVTRLILSGNDIGPEGVATLAAALETNSTLTSFHLRYNGIGDEGAARLAAALENNYALEELRFNFPDLMQEQVHQLLARNVARYRQWQNSVMAWMWASKHLHVRLPWDVALMIGKMIWKTRTINESPSIGGDTHASSPGPRKRARVLDEVPQ